MKIFFPSWIIVISSPQENKEVFVVIVRQPNLSNFELSKFAFLIAFSILSCVKFSISIDSKVWFCHNLFKVKNIKNIPNVIISDGIINSVILFLKFSLSIMKPIDKIEIGKSI